MSVGLSSAIAGPPDEQEDDQDTSPEQNAAAPIDTGGLRAHGTQNARHGDTLGSAAPA